MNKHAHKSNDFSVFEKMAKGSISTALVERTLKTVDPKGKIIARNSTTGEFRVLTSGKSGNSLKSAVAEVMSLKKDSKNARIARVVYLLDLATQAFGDEKLATKFLEKKHPSLGDTPLAKTDTEWGVRAVEEILNSMIYGLPA